MANFYYTLQILILKLLYTHTKESREILIILIPINY